MMSDAVLPDAAMAPPGAATAAESLPRTRATGTVAMQYLTVLGVVGAITIAATYFTPLIGAHATALLYLLTVFVLALFVTRGPALLAAAMSALLWDYFFLPPVFAFRINGFEDGMLFVMYFVVALTLGQLTARIRDQEEAERQREARATSLYLLTRELSEAATLEAIAAKAIQQIASTFKADAVILLPDSQDRLGPYPHGGAAFGASDAAAAQWVMQKRRPAGKLTEHFPDAQAHYLPLAAGSGIVGVIGLRVGQSPPFSLQQHNLLESFSQQIAMALDRLRLHELSEKARVLAESERLSKTLLDSMSHEIRTPIAAIQSAIGNVGALGESNLSAVQRQMLGEIREAAQRLNRLVGNALEANRLESGALKPRINECDVADLVHLSVAEMEKEMSRHQVRVHLAPGLPLVKMDFVLMQQALMNLLSNAAFHTPAGTTVEISARVEDGVLQILVADRGPGVPADSLPRLFDKFYRAPNAPSGGAGLGLSLVKGFVEAQGGRVTAQNREGGGMAFAIRLALRKAAPHSPALLCHR